MLENTPDLWREAVPHKNRAAHKYDHGHTLVYGGHKPMIGAALLAAKAAQRVGSGLVTIACDNATWPVYASHCLSVMTRVVEDGTAWQALLADKRVSSVVIGPGAGQTATLKERVLAALGAGKPIVLDADALTCFADDPAVLFNALHKDCVLTPHAGEFARLFAVQGDRAAQITAATTITSPATLVLKGHETLIADGVGTVVINQHAPPWLATAGSGDVLAGLIGGLLAQGVPTKQAACMGVWLHGMAAKPFGYGMVAEDLLVQPLAALLDTV